MRLHVWWGDLDAAGTTVESFIIEVLRKLGALDNSDFNELLVLQ